MARKETKEYWIIPSALLMLNPGDEGTKVQRICINQIFLTCILEIYTNTNVQTKTLV